MAARLLDIKLGHYPASAQQVSEQADGVGGGASATGHPQGGDDQLDTLFLTCARQGGILPGAAVGESPRPPTGAPEALTMAIATVATRSSLGGDGETERTRGLA
jgi:hypothetical protein